MAKKQIKHKPLTESQYKKVYGVNPLSDLALNTGARIKEIWRIINVYNGEDYLDVQTKKSGDSTNRIYLSKEARLNLDDLIEKFRGKTTKTLQREFTRISQGVGIKFTSHNLRATFITRLLILGVNLPAVQTLANHSSVVITSQYVKFDELYLREALESLNSYDRLEGMSKTDLLKENIELRKRMRILEGHLHGK